MAIGISAVILSVLTCCDLKVCATYVLVALVAAAVCATYVLVALVAALVCATYVLVTAVESESERVQPRAWADAGVQVLPFLEVY